MAVVAMKQLLEAGVHFGHQTRRWDPKMAEYIFQARNGIHIIDLQKTSKKLDEAYAFLKEQAEAGKTVLFVGTKKQAQECVKEAAEKCGMYYVNQRWLGGTLTNFTTIRKRIGRLLELEKMQEDGTFEVLPPFISRTFISILYYIKMQINSRDNGKKILNNFVKKCLLLL